jgi:phage FluMu gp28-like protein
VSPEARATLASLKQALPPKEWAAVSAWLNTFYPFQLEWLLDWGRFSLINKSRQIGNSFTFGAAGVLWGLFGDTTTIISLGEKEALEVVEKATRHAKVLAGLGSQWAKAKPKNGELVMASGGRVLSLPTRSGGRSYSGNVILDELAYYEQVGVRPEKVWDAAGGTVLHGYRLRGASTPNGVGNFWHQLWTNPQQHEGYRLHEVTIDQAIADGMTVDIADCWKQARHDERIFNQLFRCCFLDNDQQYLPSELLNACKTLDTAPSVGATFAGLDIGKEVDLTALVIVKLCARVRWVHHIAILKRTTTEDIETLAKLAFGPFKCQRLGVDSTGLGAFPAQQLQKKYGLRRVECVNFSQVSKEDMATGVFQTAVDGQLRIPASLPESGRLFNDLASVRRIVGTTGLVKYDAPHTIEGHADTAWALALALKVARSEPVRGMIQG